MSDLSQFTDLGRLTLLIQRIRDADVINDELGAALLRETEAARQHIEQVACLAKTFLDADAITTADGRVLLEAAHRLLTGESRECVARPPLQASGPQDNKKNT